jgi:xanthine dehydrogenase accessory factor
VLVFAGCYRFPHPEVPVRLLLAAPLALVVFACTRPAEPAAEATLASVAAVATDAASTCGDVDAPACGAHAEAAEGGGCAAHAGAGGHATVAAGFDRAPAPGDKALCLVMNREFIVDDRTVTSVHEGKTYAFCCDGCKEAFDENPAKYVQAPTKPATLAVQ